MLDATGRARGRFFNFIWEGRGLGSILRPSDGEVVSEVVHARRTTASRAASSHAAGRSRIAQVAGEIVCEISRARQAV